ncbi:MAG TPA: hypothetical protein VLZ83_04675 [Edaphocola sp.]|nr:hypothetical protein [Edaphocola sp.]
MKKFYAFSISLLLLGTFIANAQSSTKEVKKQTLKKSLELKIPRKGGANAANVAWHPIQKKYYAVMAGNADFCLGVYDKNGKILSSPEQKALIDIRGLWYNPIRETIQLNGFDQAGWAEFQLNKNGIPTGVKTFFPGMQQPNEQSVGAYDSNSDILYFLNNSNSMVAKYELKTGKRLVDGFISLGASNEEEDENNLFAMKVDLDYSPMNSYNRTTVVYTGIPFGEIGFLNCGTKSIELYSLETGFKTHELKLPNEAKTELALNFAYANELYWLFNKETQTWEGFK